MFQKFAPPFWKPPALVCRFEISVFTLFSVEVKRRNCGAARCGPAPNVISRILAYSRESLLCLSFGSIHDGDLYVLCVKDTNRQTKISLTHLSLLDSTVSAFNWATCFEPEDDLILRSCDRTSWYISIVKPTGCTIFRVYWISPHMFRTVFPSIIGSQGLYIQHQVYVIQVSWLVAGGQAR
jgi:hypothetical protein